MFGTILMTSCLHKIYKYVPYSLPLFWYCKQKTWQDLEIYVPVYCDFTNVLVMYGDVTTDRSALKIVNKHWKQLLEEQDFLGTPEGWRKMLALVPNKVKEMLDQEWQETEMPSIQKWRRLLAEVKVNFWRLCYMYVTTMLRV